MIEQKNFTIALLVSFFLGTLGIDRFYLGCPLTGLLKLLTFGGLGVWALVDFIRIATGSRLCGGFSWDDKVSKVTDAKYIKTDLIFIFVSLAVAAVLLYFLIDSIKKWYKKAMTPIDPSKDQQ
jgi:TM2 domain-containing membrane protein YozV